TSVVVSGFTILSHTSILVAGVVFLIGVAILIIGDLFTYVTLHLYYLVIYDYVKNSNLPKGMDETLIKSSIHGTAAKKGNGGGLFQTGGGTSPDMKDFVK
ncbi:MAG: hypothetical protein M1562_02225, partial [Candidatus Marsarchaeota archaeon]|nr:hypothetical protein [Candidatus Marsarchaeota archaeon]